MYLLAKYINANITTIVIGSIDHNTKLDPAGADVVSRGSTVVFKLALSFNVVTIHHTITLIAATATARNNMYQTR